MLRTEPFRGPAGQVAFIVGAARQRQRDGAHVPVSAFRRQREERRRVDAAAQENPDGNIAYQMMADRIH